MAHWTPQRTSAPLEQLAVLGAPPSQAAPAPSAPGTAGESEWERRLREQNGWGGDRDMAPNVQSNTASGNYNPLNAAGYNLSFDPKGAALGFAALGPLGLLGGAQVSQDPLGAFAYQALLAQEQRDASSAGLDSQAAAESQVGNDGLSGFLALNDNFSSVDASPGFGEAASNAGGMFGGAQSGDVGFARGGSVTADRLSGPNPRGQDDGYGALSAGEYVMRESAVQQHGQAAMQALNEGRARITLNDEDGNADVQQLARMGRGGDTELVHMTKGEVAGMQEQAEKHGGSLTRNPETGLHEAWIMDALGIGASLFSANKGRQQAKELSSQSQAADTWGQSGGRALAGTQLQQLMQDPGQASAADPGYRMRIQGAQRAMAPQGQDSGAMAVAAAGASSDWYNQRLAQLGTLAGAPGQPGIALGGQQAANQQYGQSLGSLGFGIDQAARLFSNPGAGSSGGATPARRDATDFWSMNYG